MKVQTFSIVCGTSACNARCPFCVSKMTVENGVGLKPSGPINYRNLKIAGKLALASGCTTAMITSKGEPTLFPEDVDAYVRYASEMGFPLIELQTNGIPIWDHRNDPLWEEGADSHLRIWHRYGLSTIAISVVHHDPEMNRKNYVPYRKTYTDVPGLIEHLHAWGFSVRLAVVGVRGLIDTADKLKEMVHFAKDNKVEQLTWRPVNRPTGVKQDGEIVEWVRNNYVLAPEIIEMVFENEGTHLLSMPNGASVFDYEGQNICITNSLTKPVGDDVRQLIFFPDGRVMYDWVYEGARIL